MAAWTRISAQNKSGAGPVQRVRQGEVYDFHAGGSRFRLLVVSSDAHNAVRQPWIAPIRHGAHDAPPYLVTLHDTDPLGPCGLGQDGPRNTGRAGAGHNHRFHNEPRPRRGGHGVRSLAANVAPPSGGATGRRPVT